MLWRHERVRKPFAASLFANIAYLLLGLATCDAVGAPWQWADAALGALGIPVPVPDYSAPRAADALVAAARNTSSAMLQVLLMLPLFLLVTVASTVWWGDVAVRGAAAASSASGAGNPPPAPVAAPATAPAAAGASAFSGVAASALRVVALVLVQAEAAALDAVGRSIGAPSLTRLPVLLSACGPPTTPGGASVLCLVGGALFSGQFWGWALGMGMRLVAAASLGAVYAHMATDPARAVSAAAASPAVAPGPMERMLAADAELPWMLGAGLPLTIASALAGEWGGFHVGTAAYGVGYSLLAAMAAASPWAATSAAGGSAGKTPTVIPLFATNAAAAGWLVTWILGPG